MRSLKELQDQERECRATCSIWKMECTVVGIGMLKLLRMMENLLVKTDMELILSSCINKMQVLGQESIPTLQLLKTGSSRMTNQQEQQIYQCLQQVVLEIFIILEITHQAQWWETTQNQSVDLFLFLNGLLDGTNAGGVTKPWTKSKKWFPSIAKTISHWMFNGVTLITCTAIEISPMTIQNMLV